MKILIIGNIGSGKTMLAHHILDRIDAFFTSIDEMRMQFGDGSFEKEYLAWSHFLHYCESPSTSSLLILEFSGAGCHKHSVRQALLNSGDTGLIIYLNTPVETCRERLTLRKSLVPYPWLISPKDVVERIHLELTESIRSEFWKIPGFSVLTLDGTNLSETSIEPILSIIRSHQHRV